MVAAAGDKLEAIDLRSLRKGVEAIPAKVAGASLAAKAKAPIAGVPKVGKAPPAGKAKSMAASAAAPPPPRGAAAALALGELVEAFVAMRRGEKPPAFPMVWPVVPFMDLHSRLQQAMLSGQTACVLCPGAAAYRAATLYCETSGAFVSDLKDMQVRQHLAKTLDIEGARAEIGGHLRKAMEGGCRCALLLGDAPQNLRHLCDAKRIPIEAFDGEKVAEAAQALGLKAAKDGFHVTLIAQLAKEHAQKRLAQLVPSFDEMAVIVLDVASVPAWSTLVGEAQATATSVRAALRILLLPPDDTATVAASVAEWPCADSVGEDSALVNTQHFEFVETFGEDWEQRWFRGPASTDENGKQIRHGLINTMLIKYPSDPKYSKPCLQLMGGAANAPCTGIWTSFTPLARPTEVEFEFTMNGKVDMPNACVVFTEKSFEGALPDAKIGVQFMVRSGCQLSGGTGNLVRISNDGKIRNDRWNKVLLKIDWDEKLVVGQVDSQGKGYPPAQQSVPFRDSMCHGFGFLYIYNTDVQGTSWFHSLRVKQDQADEFLDRNALDARAEMARRLREKQYQRAVDEDMEVGMKMGAISSTKEHGMNLAQEQAANSASAAGAAMG